MDEPNSGACTHIILQSHSYEQTNSVVQQRHQTLIALCPQKCISLLHCPELVCHVVCKNFPVPSSPVWECSHFYSYLPMEVGMLFKKEKKIKKSSQHSTKEVSFLYKGAKDQEHSLGLVLASLQQTRTSSWPFSATPLLRQNLFMKDLRQLKINARILEMSTFPSKWQIPSTINSWSVH